MKKLAKDAFVLLIITLLAGLFLGVVYEMTKGPIAVQKEKAKTEANLEVFPDAVSLKQMLLLIAKLHRKYFWMQV